MATPTKNLHGRRSNLSGIYKDSENLDPNLANSTPSRKPIKSPLIKKAKSKKSAVKTLIPVVSTPSPAKERNLPSAKKSSKGKDGRTNAENDLENWVSGSGGLVDLEGSLKVRKMRSMMLEEAMSSIPEPGAGRVMHLVKAFERLLSLKKEPDAESVEGNKGKVTNWGLPGLYQPTTAQETEMSPSPVFASLEIVTRIEVEGDSSEHSSADRSNDRLSWGSGTPDGSRRSRRNCTDDSRRSWNKKLKATNQQPFKLRTEQRGRMKEEHFFKKVEEMLLEEEKLRIPVAQGLPWTTENPECLVKPSVKEPTEPIDLVLHSDVRALERSEFDHHVVERMSFIEQIKMEKERLKKLEEEEEVRILRRELVPRAQPMPYFDRPFVPKKSTKPWTVPKEPRLSSCQTKTWR